MVRIVFGALMGATLLTPFAVSASVVSTEAQRAYTNWKSSFITSNGAGSNNLRVNDPSAGNITVSEGQGYGMLLAVRHNDRATFDALWRYTRSKLDERGLMHWRVDQNGIVTGKNSATDGDEDIAYALLLAQEAWGSTYGADARTYIRAMYQHEVEAGTYVLKPGDVWGGSDATNPSYFAPSYYRAFAEATGENGWLRVLDKSYEILFAARHETTGLLPEWTTATGETATRVTWNRNRDNFSYNAVRVPWRVAADWVENRDPRAKDIVEKSNRFFASQGAFVSGYTLDGRSLSNYLDGTFMSGIAAGAAVSSDPAFRNRVTNQLVAMNPSGYYSSSFRALTLLLLADAEGSFPRVSGVTGIPARAELQPTVERPVIRPIPTVTEPITPTPSITDVAVTPTPGSEGTTSATPRALEVMLPGGNATVSGEKKFKVRIRDLDPKLYTATWSVDGGQDNPMRNANPSLKQAKISFDRWTWRGAGPYRVTFTAKNLSGTVIGQTTVEIFVKH